MNLNWDLNFFNKMYFEHTVQEQSAKMTKSTRIKVHVHILHKIHRRSKGI